MDYLLTLRKYVGHAPLQMIGAAVLLVDAQNRLLLLKRSDSGCWGPPGGGVELGEVVEETARRETREETALELGELEWFGLFSGPGLYYCYPNGDEVYNITVVYKACQWQGEVKLNEEHTEWRWFTPADIPENISPPIRPVIEKFKKLEDRG
jgi:ADP-ribose pyrophosphatase YjhB (NUDIX family)